MVDSQKSLLCAFYILSRDYIESHRIARDHRSLYRNFERFFVRIYIKRVSVIERCLEFALGRPIFRYSYFMFQVRYKERAASRECTGISVRRIGEKFSETCDQSDDWFGLYSA